MSYLNVPTLSGASTPDDTRLAMNPTTNGNLVLTTKVAPTSWASGVAQPLMSQMIAAGASGSRWWMGITATGQLQYKMWNNAAGTLTVTMTSPLGFSAGTAQWVQIIHNLQNGQVNFRSSIDDGVTFTDLQAAVTGLATTPEATAGTAPIVRIGTDADGLSMPGQILFTRLSANSLQAFNKDWRQEIPGSIGPWSDPSVAGSVSFGETWTRIGTASIQGTLQIVKAPAAVNPVNRLGCGDARAEIWTRGGGVRVIDLPNITAVEWNRVRSDTSLGSVTMDGVAIAADPSCCAILNTVRPWKHELHIYRDDKRTWLGPINEIDLDGPVLQIKARDVSAWMDKRFVHFNHQWGGGQANQGSENSDVLLLALALDGASTEPSFIGVTAQIFQRVSTNGARPLDLMQRTYSPAQFKLVGPEIRDMAKGALDWTVINRLGYVNPSTWTQVLPNPVTNPTFESNVTGWTGLTRDTGVFHSGAASGRTAAPPTVTGSITGLVVGQRYQLRCWLRGTSSALDTLQKSNDDGVVKVGNDQSSVFSWYVYGQPTTPTHDDRGRAQWVQLGVFFTATASTMPITINARGNPIDSHGIYFDDFEVWQPSSSFFLRDYSLAEPAKIALSGLDQTNRAIVANQQSGGDYAFYQEAPKPVWPLGSVGPPSQLGVAWQILVNFLWNDLANHTVPAGTQWYVDVGGGDLRVFQNVNAIVDNSGSGGINNVQLESVDFSIDNSDVGIGNGVVPIIPLSYFSNGVVSSPATGGAGAFTPDQLEFGLLEGISTQPLADGAGAQASASQRAASLGGTPLVLDKIVLDPNAGVTMAQLIPGIQFTLRLDEPCFAVQADLVLQSVTVKTTPTAGEQVELGFEPTGF